MTFVSIGMLYFLALLSGLGAARLQRSPHKILAAGFAAMEFIMAVTLTLIAAR